MIKFQALEDYVKVHFSLFFLVGKGILLFFVPWVTVSSIWYFSQDRLQIYSKFLKNILTIIFLIYFKGKTFTCILPWYHRFTMKMINQSCFPLNASGTQHPSLIKNYDLMKMRKKKTFLFSLD